jgi:hypothetical protein
VDRLRLQLCAALEGLKLVLLYGVRPWSVQVTSS